MKYLSLLQLVAIALLIPMVATDSMQLLEVATNFRADARVAELTGTLTKVRERASVWVGTRERATPESTRGVPPWWA